MTWGKINRINVCLLTEFHYNGAKKKDLAQRVKRSENEKLRIGNRLTHLSGSLREIGF